MGNPLTCPDNIFYLDPVNAPPLQNNCCRLQKKYEVEMPGGINAAYFKYQDICLPNGD